MRALKELQDEYELKLEEIVNEIKTQKPKSVLLQFPDGLKPYALEIADFLEEKTGAKILIWFGSCFGACDVPNSSADLIIQFGHAIFSK